MNAVTLGKQVFGQSSEGVYKLALQAFADSGLDAATIADIGAGQGNLELLIAAAHRPVLMVDDFKPVYIPAYCEWMQADLNEHWLLGDRQFDFVYALEVIEHLENPRHFFRELIKIIKPDGYGFVSTPNNEGFFSKLSFVFNGQHRWFQDSGYPAHITPLLKIDIIRILAENKLDLCKSYYGGHDYIPKLGVIIKTDNMHFSKNIGVLFKRRL